MSKKVSDEAENPAFNKGAVMRSFSEDDLKAFVIQLRKKHRDIEEKQFFCNDHNFKLEAEARRGEAEVVRRIIHEMEKAFDLGFVWDSSLS